MFVARGEAGSPVPAATVHEETRRNLSVAEDARPPPARKQRSTRRHEAVMFVAGAEEAMLLRVLQVPLCS